MREQSAGLDDVADAPAQLQIGSATLERPEVRFGGGANLGWDVLRRFADSGRRFDTVVHVRSRCDQPIGDSQLHGPPVTSPTALRPCTGPQPWPSTWMSAWP